MQRTRDKAFSRSMNDISTLMSSRNTASSHPSGHHNDEAEQEAERRRALEREKSKRKLEDQEAPFHARTLMHIADGSADRRDLTRLMRAGEAHAHATGANRLGACQREARDTTRRSRCPA